ncbi:MAG: hypothetical protein C0467_03730 [Planctomycetaceae bacterium]|nr:hypothetical protein [Planctomycetaceae bacterium]
MRRQWSLSVTALLITSLSAVTAQPPKAPAEGKWIIPLTVDATATPRPALKYRLLPELRELQTGNQIQAFYKCFFEQNYLFHNKESTDNQQKWMDAPLKELAGVKELVGYGGTAAKQANYAARLDAVDWQITNQAKAEGVYLLLPDVQQMRSLATVLKVRVRGEIARGEFDNAIQTLQTMFALGRIFNDHPTLIGHLVGIAITSSALAEVEEFVQEPGAPNLFWALTDLPTPFIDLRKGSQGEKLLVSKEFEILGKGTSVEDRELKALLKRFDPLVGLSNGGKFDMKPSVWYAVRAEDKAEVTAARDRLSKLNPKPAELDKFSTLQTILADDFSQYEVDLDEFVKWSNLPFWQLPADFATQKRAAGPFGELLPAWYKVMLAKVRLQQHFALIVVGESIRAYAAVNSGKLPGSLDAVKLPLPVDPVTGKPFAYEVKDDKAVLSATPPADQIKNPAHNRVYEITIRK